MTRLKHPLFILYMIVATELIGFGLVIPILPQIGLKFASSDTMLSVLVAAYSASQLVAAPLLGSLSDRYGRKPILVLSKLGSMLGYVGFGLSGTYWMMLASRLLDGFTGGNISTARAYVADITTESDRPKGMAVIGMAFGTGFILGPALGGVLYDWGGHGHLVPGLVAAALSLVATVMTGLFLPEPLVRQPHTTWSFKAVRQSLCHPLVGVMLGCQIVYMVMFSAFESTFSVFTFQVLGYSERQNSALFLYIGLFSLLIQGGIIRRAPKKMGLMTGVGLLITGVAFALLWQSDTTPLLLGGLGVLALGVGLVNSYLPAWVSTHAPADSRGAMMGVFEGIGSGARVLGPFIGFLSFLSPLEGGFIYFAFGCVLMVLVLWLGRRVSVS